LTFVVVLTTACCSSTEADVINDADYCFWSLLSAITSTAILELRTRRWISGLAFRVTLLWRQTTMN